MNKTFYTLLAVFISAGLISATAAAQEEELEQSVNDFVDRCVNTRRVRRTVIVDDQNILFYMSGQKAYLNVLPRRCNGLKRAGSFSYRISTNRLCDLDSIRVLNSGPGGLEQGIACGLGLFHAISRDEADALRNPPEVKIEERPVPLPEPEDLGAGETDSNDKEPE